MFKKEVLRELGISSLNYSVVIKSNDEADTIEKMSRKIIDLLKKIKDVDK